MTDQEKWDHAQKLRRLGYASEVKKISLKYFVSARFIERALLEAGFSPAPAKTEPGEVQLGQTAPGFRVLRRTLKCCFCGTHAGVWWYAEGKRIAVLRVVNRFGVAAVQRLLQATPHEMLCRACKDAMYKEKNAQP